jgi:hypothetical protein
MADDKLEMTFKLRGTPEAIAAIQQMQRALERAGQRRDTTKAHSELDALKREFKSVADAIGGLLKPALGGFSLSLSGMVLGLGAASVGLAKFSTSLLAMKEGANRVGMTFQQYRGTLEAAARVNIGKGEMAASLEAIDKLIFDLRHRVPGAGAELAKLGGHDVLEAMRNARDANEGLLIIMQKMLRLDPAGARLLAETAGVSPKITRMKIQDVAEAQREAKDLTAAELDKLRHEQMEMAKLAVQYRNAQQSLAVAFAPAITPIVEALTKVLANKDVIGTLANSLNQLTSAIAALTPEQVESLSKKIGEFVKFVGASVQEFATAFGAIADFMDRVQRMQARSARGEAPFGTYDIKKGRMLTLEEEEAARQQGGVPSLFPPTWVDTVGVAYGDLRWENIKQGIGSWLRTPLIGPMKETSESLGKLNEEYQKILDGMRGTAGGGFGTGAGGGGGPGGGGGGGGGGVERTVHTGDAPFGTGPGTGRPDYFQRQGMGPPSAASLSVIDTPYGKVVAHPQAATDAEAFFKDLKESGAPVSSFGDYAARQKRFGPGWSSHAYGTAWDVDNQQYPAAFMAWTRAHPDQWHEILKRHHMTQYMPQRDPGHIEWTGPGVGTRFDKITAGKDAAAAKTKNQFDITIDASKAHELMNVPRKGVPRIPSPTLGPSSAQQSPNMPQRGDQTGAASYGY